MPVFGRLARPLEAPPLKPLWHPLSTLLLVDPPCFATVGLLRMLLRQGPVDVRYAGDRMWPSVRHGSRFVARPLPEGALAPGTAVVAAREGIPDLLRVARSSGDSLWLAADADPAPPIELPRRELLASSSLVARRPSPHAAARRRRWLELHEAWSGSPDARDEPASTVRDKYEAQAAFYAANTLGGLAPALLRRVTERLPTGSRVLVLGSGAGFECFDLAVSGYRVTGLDFAPPMIAHARDEARRRALDVTFVLGDVRDPSLELGRFEGILFTYDVYSFIPTRAAREQVLRRLAHALEPSGAIFLSARIVQSAHERLLLALQRARRRGAEWGDSHTRWIDASGELHRSYVRLFSARAVAAEVRAVGLRLDSWEAGHALVLRDEARTLL